MVSFDAETFFSSIPLNKCIELIKKIQADVGLKARTELTPKDETDLINLCISTSDFFYDNKHSTTHDSRLIGLILMVTIFQIWTNHTINEARKIAKKRKIKAPRALKVYMDDTFGIMHKNTSNTSHLDFITILKEIDPKIKFTFETEKNSKIPFLDTVVIREKDGSNYHSDLETPWVKRHYNKPRR